MLFNGLLINLRPRGMVFCNKSYGCIAKGHPSPHPRHARYKTPFSDRLEGSIKVPGPPPHVRPTHACTAPASPSPWPKSPPQPAAALPKGRFAISRRPPTSKGSRGSPGLGPPLPRCRTHPLARTEEGGCDRHAESVGVSDPNSKKGVWVSLYTMDRLGSLVGGSRCSNRRTAGQNKPLAPLTSRPLQALATAAARLSHSTRKQKTKNWVVESRTVFHSLREQLLLPPVPFQRAPAARARASFRGGDDGGGASMRRRGERKQGRRVRQAFEEAVGVEADRIREAEGHLAERRRARISGLRVRRERSQPFAFK